MYCNHYIFIYAHLTFNTETLFTFKDKKLKSIILCNRRRFINSSLDQLAEKMF